MRWSVLASVAGVLASSCALTLDFDTDRTTSIGTGASGGGGEGTGGAGGSVPALQGWVASMSAAPAGAAVRLQSVIAVGDTTWVGGYYIGESLSLVDAAGSSQTLHSGPMAIHSFAVALDGAGGLTTFVPIARSAIGEIDTESWAGTLLHSAGGKILAASTYRDGQTLFDAGTPAQGLGWNLALLELDEAGAVGWASRCSAAPLVDDEFVSMSARFAGFTTESDGSTLFGATIERSASVTCDTLVGAAGAGDCDLTQERLTQSAPLWSLAPGGACTIVAIVQTERDGAPGVPLWLDGLAATSGVEVLFGGHVSAGDATIQPWGVDVAAALGFGLAGTLAPDGSATSANLQTLADVSSTVVVGAEEYFAGSLTNAEDALDLVIGKRGSEPLRLGSAQALRDEAATSISVEGGALLITGWMTDKSSLSSDVCGEACQGDLITSPAGTCAPDPLKHDGFWLLLQAGTTPGLPAVGRTVSGCQEQRAVAGHLAADTMTLLFELEGETTIDLLDGSQAKVEAPTQTRAGVVVRLPRPAL